MLGAILGDIIGTPYEKNNTSSKKFTLFLTPSRFSGGTVMSLAVAEGLIKGYGSTRKTRISIAKSMKELYKAYPRFKYGENMSNWLESETPKPFNFSGNEAAIRSSACAWVYNSLKYVEFYAEITAKMTHNNSEAVKATKALCASIFLARQGVDKEYIKSYIEDVYYYDLSKSSEILRATNPKTKEAKYTFPLAFVSFYEGNSYEEVIRIAVSLGGDSAGIATMAGSIAEAYYTIPEEISKNVDTILDDRLKTILKDYRDNLDKIRQKRKQKFDKLMESKAFFDKKSKTEWFAPKPIDNQKPFPYPRYGEEVNFMESLCQDMDFGDFSYEDTLYRYGLENAELDVYLKKAKDAPPYMLKAMLTDIVRQERFVDGNIADAIRFGVISEILESLEKSITYRMF